MSDLLDRLQLIRSENVGPVTYRRLTERYGSAAAALRALPQLAQRGGAKRPIAIADRAKCEAELAALDKAGVQILMLGTAAYPPLLAQCDDAPPLLFGLGDVAILQRSMIGIVGARNASLNARSFAGTVARDLGSAGHAIVSGLARGIDGAAHEAALPTGTVAVVAGGLDIIYPEEHRDLQARIIASGGAIVSEMPLGAPPTNRDFPRRNRIIAGLCRGTVVVEAAVQSGSLITARMAADYGREVFAVPGSPLDPRAGGTNNLLRDGAHLTTGAADVLRELAGTKTQTHLADPGLPPLQPDTALPDEDLLAAARPRVLELLSPVPAPLDALLRAAANQGLAGPVVLTILLELELAGRLVREPGARVALRMEVDQKYG